MRRASERREGRRRRQQRRNSRSTESDRHRNMRRASERREGRRRRVREVRKKTTIPSLFELAAQKLPHTSEWVACSQSHLFYI